MADQDQSIIDYVLIISKDLSDEGKKIVSVYVKNLNQQGLITYEENGEFSDCIKIHAPDGVLDNIAEILKVALTKNNPHYKIQKIRWKLFANLLTDPKENDPIFRSGRAALLSSNKYGNLPDEKGYQTLIKRGFLLDAYPLHDSSFEWTNEGPLTDRQLLARYWASLKCFYNYQPLNLIEKYYGPEIGFYFAWMGFYIQLLVPAAVLGLLCFIAGLMLYTIDTDYIEKEVCESNQLICPVCPSTTFCNFIPLKDSCEKFKIAYVLENPITIDYSILMIFWGVIYMISWRRKEAMLKMRWNINQLSGDRVTRPEFIEAATLNRISSITGDKEYYFPLWHKLLIYSLSYIVFLIMFFAYIIALISVIIFRLNFMRYGRRNKDRNFMTKHLETSEMFASSLLSIVMIYIFKLFKNRLCRKLTEWENPRTEKEFLMQYKTKVIILSFGNIFFPILYLAYFKGKFFTHPGDVSQWTFFGIGKADVCHPSGCLVDLSIQLMMIMGVDNAVRLVQEILLPYIKVKLKQFVYKLKDPIDSSRQWEEDFRLIQQETNFLDNGYLEIALQHGYMSFFMVAFPLAPVFALFNTVLKMRFEAIRLLKRSRRVVPRYNIGIEQWNSVFQVITVLGTIANPLLITFGSNFIPRLMYRLQNDNSLTGFINSTLSEFLVDDYPKTRSLDNVTTSCLYFSRRYPPTHPRRYELTSEFWILIAIKAIVFMGLENICLLFSLFLNYVVPSIPRKVEIKVEYEQEMLREMRVGNMLSKNR